MCGRHLLNNNYKYYSDFFMGVNLFFSPFKYRFFRITTAKYFSLER